MSFLDIKNLRVQANGREILKGIDLEIARGEVAVIMGPNGSGKSTLANVIMGHPAYQITAGNLLFAGQNISVLTPEERAALGIFLSFQQPREILGVDYYPFLFEAHKSLAERRQEEPLDVFAFKENLDERVKDLGVTADWAQRSLNVGFSGGEKKKSEMLQLAMLKPKLAIFDEIDSGLDVDALELVGRQLAEFVSQETSALVVTHYPRILKYLPVTKLVVMSGGQVVARGGPELAAQLEREGFSAWQTDHN